MTDAGYTDDLALLANAPIQAKYLLHSLEKEAWGIGLCVMQINFICFKKQGVISTLNNKPLKVVDQFTYLGSNILSTENNINIYIAKGWTASNR